MNAVPLHPLLYRNDCNRLPASAPIDHPHLLVTNGWNASLIDLGNLRFCDGLYTLLFKWKPQAVDLFMDWNSPLKLVFYCRPKGTSPLERELVVLKMGNRVEVAFKPRLLPKFHAQITFEIQASGEWTPVESIEDDMAYGIVADGVSRPHDGYYKGAMFSSSILSGQMWDITQVSNIGLYDGRRNQLL